MFYHLFKYFWAQFNNENESFLTGKLSSDFFIKINYVIKMLYIFPCSFIFSDNVHKKLLDGPDLIKFSFFFPANKNVKRTLIIFNYDTILCKQNLTTIFIIDTIFQQHNFHFNQCYFQQIDLIEIELFCDGKLNGIVKQ